MKLSAELMGHVTMAGRMYRQHSYGQALVPALARDASLCNLGILLAGRKAENGAEAELLSDAMGAHVRFHEVAGKVAEQLNESKQQVPSGPGSRLHAECLNLARALLRVAPCFCGEQDAPPVSPRRAVDDGRQVLRASLQHCDDALVRVQLGREQRSVMPMYGSAVILSTEPRADSAMRLACERIQRHPADRWTRSIEADVSAFERGVLGLREVCAEALANLPK